MSLHVGTIHCNGTRFGISRKSKGHCSNRINNSPNEIWPKEQAVPVAKSAQSFPLHLLIVTTAIKHSVSHFKIQQYISI